MGGSTTSAAVGRTIRASRKRAQLPLARVARECKLSPAQLDGIECGRARPTIAVLDRIARALGLSLVELVLAPGPAVASRPGLAEIAHAIVALPDAIGSKIDIVEAATVLVALTACQKNQSAAARLLGMDRKAFVRRLSRARRARLDPDVLVRREE
jgi:transcriptional regulator with XRE-family HTH domain